MLYLSEFYKNKKVLITGHTGFKGAWLAQILHRWGAQVVGVSLPPNTTPNLYTALNVAGYAKSYITDIRDGEVITKIVHDEQPEIVFHLAAQPLVRVSYDDPMDTYTTNVIGTGNVLEAVRGVTSVKSVVIITTDKVYKNKEQDYAYQEEDPLGGYDPYSASKAAADILTQSYMQSFFNPHDYGMKHTTLIGIARAGNVIGGGDWAADRLIPDIIRAQFEHGKEVTLRNLQSVRPWQHVLEPLSGYLMLGKRLYEGDATVSCAFNFGPERESCVSVEGILTEVKRTLSSLSYTVIPDTAKHEAGLLMLSIDKAVRMLDWRPKLSCARAIDETIAWYMTYYEKPETIVDYTNTRIDTFFTTSL